MNGAKVGGLEGQLDRLLEAKPTPDLVLVQILDNDMHCDGTDSANYGPFGKAIDGVLDRLTTEIPGAQVFFVSPWANADLWTDWVAGHPDKRKSNSGTGRAPSSTSRVGGGPRASGHSRRSLTPTAPRSPRPAQRTPAASLTRAPSWPSCRPTTTWHRTSRTLSIEGHRKYAELAWQALPREIKDRS